MSVTVSHLQKAFGLLKVLDDISFSIKDSSIVAIIGPSGCGKTTILNILSGILAADGGLIQGIDGHSISYCFQEPRLLGWLSAEDNMRFTLDALLHAPHARKDQIDAIEQRIHRFLEEAGLWNFENISQASYRVVCKKGWHLHAHLRFQPIYCSSMKLFQK